MILGTHSAADLWLTKHDATTPSFEEICERVLASHVICEKKGSFTAVAVIVLGFYHFGRRCHAQAEKYFHHWDHI